MDRLIAEPEEVELVGRDTELTLLENSISKLNTGRGSFSIILGEPGFGKTRLLNAVEHYAQAKQIPCLSGTCIGENAEALAPIKQALEYFLGVSDSSSRSGEKHSRIKEAIHKAAPHLLEAVPFVGAFLAEAGAEMISKKHVGEEQAISTYAGLANFLQKLSNHKGICLCVDDLHWSDIDTIYFLNYLWKYLDADPLAIFLAARPEELSPIILDHIFRWSQKGATTMNIAQLSVDETSALVQRLVGGPAAPANQIAPIRENSGGNPFIIGELLRYLLESNMLQKSNGKLEIASSPQVLPSRVEALILQRVNQVGEKSKLLAQTCSILQGSYDLEFLRSFTSQTEEDILQGLEELCHRKLLVEEENGSFHFIHEIARQSVYLSTGPNRRKILHSKAAQIFRDRKMPSISSFHYEKAGDSKSMAEMSLLAAQEAETKGTFAAALEWYRKSLPFVNPQVAVSGMVRNLLVLGKWEEAQNWLNKLDSSSKSYYLLSSDLAFLRGELSSAESLIRKCLMIGGPSEDSDSNFRLTEILLYQGKLQEAIKEAKEGLQSATGRNNVADNERWNNIAGEISLFGGKIEDARKYFEAAKSTLDESAVSSTAGTIIGNLGYIEEICGNWNKALELAQQSLQIRKSIGNARGTIDSLYSIGKCLAGLSRWEEASSSFDQAMKLADDLGERITRAKIKLSVGKLKMNTDSITAESHLISALEQFRTSGTPYDISTALLILDGFWSSVGKEKEAIKARDEARILYERNNYGLLRTLFPILSFSFRERIRLALVSYICGDAAGVPWEGKKPEEISESEIYKMNDFRGWGKGATSDDTAFTLLTGEYLVENNGLSDPADFVRLLSSRADRVKGIGPSTKRAIEQFRQNRTIRASTGETNGAAMRALPVGWATPIDAREKRLDWILRLSQTTHAGRDALVAAAVIATAGSWSIEGCSMDLLLDIAIEEAKSISSKIGGDKRISSLLSEVKSDSWRPPSGGTNLDPGTTLAAVFYCLKKSSTTADAITKAVSLGGDTDTVAALVGGLYGPLSGAPHNNIPWLDGVQLPSQTLLDSLSKGLASLRVSDHV